MDVGWTISWCREAKVVRAFVVFFLVDCDRKGEERESKPSREMHNSLDAGGGGSYGGFMAHPDAPLM